MNQLSIGQYFEEIAAKYLSKYEYTILDRNFYSKAGELDLITKLREELIFVEVKSISFDSEYSIYQSLTRQKLLRINKTAQSWLRGHSLENAIYRIEFIGIIDAGNTYYLEHFKHLRFS